MKNDLPESGLWTVQDMAVFLRTTPAAVFKSVERRQIPHIRLGRRILFDPAAVREWLGRHQVPSERTSP